MSDIKLENAICQAIDILTNKKIGQAPFDKTVRATVVEKLGPTKYRVKGEGTSVLTVQSSFPDIDYPVDSIVYVLIPGNNTNKNMMIVGGGSTKVTDYKDIVNASSVDLKSKNFIVQNKEYQLNSYYIKDNERDSQIIYDEDNPSIIDTDIDTDIVNQAKALQFSARILTNFSQTQVAGKYGIQFTLIFTDPSDENGVKQIEQTFKLSQQDVFGNPYNLTKYTEVSTVQDISGLGKFKGFKKIRLYTTDFPANVNKSGDGTKADDIYLQNCDIHFRDISIYAVGVPNAEQLSGYYASLTVGANGRKLTEDNSYTICHAVLKQRGEQINKSSSQEGFEYYWGIEDATITYGVEGFSNLLGRGWRCLNPSREDGSYTSLTPEFLFTYQDLENVTDNVIKQYRDLSVGTSAYSIKSKKVNVKCLIKFGDGRTATTDTLTILNETKFEYNVYIDSSDKLHGENKTTYYLGSGKPTLTCIVEKADGTEIEGTLEYTWQILDNKKEEVVIEPLTSLTAQNTQKIWSEEQVDEFKEVYKKAAAAAEKVVDNGDEDQVILARWSEMQKVFNETYPDMDVAEFLVMNSKIENSQYCFGNKLYNIAISQIHVRSTYSCGVILTILSENGAEKKINIGTASITLENKVGLTNGNQLFLKNGTQVFHYNENGLSPASSSLQKPLVINPLSFVWVTADGEEFDGAIIISEGGGGKCIWYLPKDNTFLQFPSDLIDQDKLDETGNYYIIENKSQIPFSIIENYDNKLKNNNIKLHVQYGNDELDIYTDFTFAKDGDPGTNGTDYISKIVPSSDTDRVYLTEYRETGKLPSQVNSILYNDLGNKVQSLHFKLYENGQVKQDTKATWTILAEPDKYYKDGKELTRSTETNLVLTGNTSEGNTKISIILAGEADPFSNNYDFSTSCPYDIIRATYDYNGFTHYAEYPINIVRIYGDNQGTSYRLKIAPKTGFKYVTYTSDGRTPRYDNTLPFKIVVEELIKGAAADDISYWTEITQFDDDTQHIPLTYSCQSLPNDDLFTITQSESSPEEFTVIPNDTFNGEILNSALLFTIKAGDKILGQLYAPIYLSLNRYGLSHLNAWDGNKTEVEDGFILSPQVGAGKKNTQNQFTGVLMGEVKSKQDIDKTDTGLFAYDKGVRTVFIDAETGKAEFGKEDSGKITIDPSKKVNSKDAALLYSGNYDLPEGDNITLDVKTYEPGEGMIIDLSTPQIGFGNGNFSVGPGGYLTAKGGGNIAGWTITDDGFVSPGERLKLGIYDINFTDDNKNSVFNIKLNPTYKNKTDENGNIIYQTEKDENGNVIYEIQKDENGNDVIDEDGNPVKVPKLKKVKDANGTEHNVPVQQFDKYAEATAQIAGWTFNNEQLSKDQIKISSKDGIIIQSTKGSDINPYFKAGTDGVTTIGSWVVKSNQINSGGSDPSIVLQPNDTVFKGNTTIGGWKVDNSSIKSIAKTHKNDSSIPEGETYQISIDSSGNISANNNASNKGWSIREDGTASFKYIEASGGKIGGLTIQNGTLTGSGFTLGPSGCHFSGLSVTNNGVNVSNGGTYGGSSGGTGITGGGGSWGGSGGHMGPLSWGSNGSGQIEKKDTQIVANGKAYEFDNYIKNLVVDQLAVTNLFMYQGRVAHWESQPFVSKLSLSADKRFLNVYIRYSIVLQTDLINGVQQTGYSLGPLGGN